MKAAIYCRVSTDAQEIEGTSLISQREACLAKAKELGYEVPPDNIILETYSGLSIERPKLTELREWVRSKQIDTIIAYTLDRVSRDPVHFIIIQDELEKNGVELILCTETIDSSDMGKLISHIKGYAAKLEAQKITERTSRGRRERVKAGKLPTGRGVLYGYDYNKDTGTNKANDCLDVVRMAGEWLINEGVSLNEVCRRLMDKGIPAPKGGLIWSRGTVGRIFRNPTYAGKSHAYKTVTRMGKRRCANTPDKMIEIPEAVDRVAFNSEEWELIQRQLERNRELSPPNQKLDYLLSGRVYCRQCGRKYYGYPMHQKPYYRCSGRIKLNYTGCTNKTFNANALESLVWQEVRKVLEKPEVILAEVKSQRESGADIDALERQLDALKKRAQGLDDTDTKNIRLYYAELWDYDKLEKETLRLRKEQAKLNKEIKDVETRIASAKEWAEGEASIIEACKLAYGNLDQFTSKEKRLALEALNIRIEIDGSTIYFNGIMPVITGSTVLLPLSMLRQRDTLHFSLRIDADVVK